ncbi:MAG: hypothetical protein E7183_05300 [Erysipelotrichaceae bacterium]|nr:hypothetical protein [Erysipelotrichaceae bacterium]
MKKILLILLLLISFLCIPYYNNDYIDITHMVNVSSMGLDYQDNKFTIYAYVINNYTMSKNDYNTSSNSKVATIITSSSDTIDDAFFKLYDSVFVKLNFSHLETIVLQTNFISSQYMEQLINYISTHNDFYPKFNVYITNENLKELFNIDYFSDTSSYYNILTEYKSEIEHHHTTFIDLINDFEEINYFVMYPSLKLKENILRDDKKGTSLYIDGYYYLSNGMLSKITYEDNSLLYFLYSTNDISFKYTNQNYYLTSLSIKTFKFNKKFYLLVYSKSNYNESFKDLIKNNLISLYNNNIDVYNLKYFDIDPNNIIILSVQKETKKSL